MILFLYFCFMNSEEPVKSIFERDKAGETIPLDDPQYPELFKVISKAIRTTAKLNTIITDDNAEIRNIFSELIAKTVDETFLLSHLSTQILAKILK